MTRSWRVDLPNLELLSLNDRMHWATKAVLVSQIRFEANWQARLSGLPTGLKRARLEMHFIPPDRRRRDATNLVATFKPIEDGLVDYGLVPDDTPEYLSTSMPIIDPPAKQCDSRIYLIITEPGEDE